MRQLSSHAAAWLAPLASMQHHTVQLLCLHCSILQRRPHQPGGALALLLLKCRASRTIETTNKPTSHAHQPGGALALRFPEVPGLGALGGGEEVVHNLQHPLLQGGGLRSARETREGRDAKGWRVWRHSAAQRRVRDAAQAGRGRERISGSAVEEAALAACLGARDAALPGRAALAALPLARLAAALALCRRRANGTQRGVLISQPKHGRQSILHWARQRAVEQPHQGMQHWACVCTHLTRRHRLPGRPPRQPAEPPPAAAACPAGGKATHTTWGWLANQQARMGGERQPIVLCCRRTPPARPAHWPQPQAPAPGLGVPAAGCAVQRRWAPRCFPPARPRPRPAGGRGRGHHSVPEWGPCDAAAPDQRVRLWQQRPAWMQLQRCSTHRHCRTPLLPAVIASGRLDARACGCGGTSAARWVRNGGGMGRRAHRRLAALCRA